VGGEVDGYDGVHVGHVPISCTLVTMASGVQGRSTPVGVGVEERRVL